MAGGGQLVAGCMATIGLFFVVIGLSTLVGTQLL
jgi:hypothetical protein